MVAFIRLFSAAVPVILASLYVSASPTPSESLRGLLARATSAIDPSTIPAQCKADCNTIVNKVNSCTDAACICTDANMDAIAACFDCGVKNSGSQADSVTKLAQDSADLIISSCKDAGKPVKSVTISASAKGNGASHFGVVNMGTLATVALGITLVLA